VTDSIEKALDLYRTAEAAAPKRPFRFLDAYERGDRDIFFGRDKEIEELRARFYKSRTGVVFGESGAGKTSVLQCGLANAISPEEAEFLIVRSNLAPRAAICKALGADDDSTPLADLLAARASETSRTVVLVFDQFEEFFLFREQAERESILRELSAALTRRLDIRLIFCLREEFLARMTEVERVIPDVLANKFWLRRMDAADAVQVIEGPCRRADVKIDPGLASAILNRLRDPRGEIDLPYLQLVLDRLYVHAEARGQPVHLRMEDLEALGSLDEILFGFLEEQVEESRSPELARALLKLFVTTGRTRKAVDVDTAARELAGRFPDETKTTLRELMLEFVGARILRQDASEQQFELRHDKLAEAIGRWLTPLDEKRAQMKQLVDARYAEHQATGALIVDPALLARIEGYIPELGLPEPVREFLKHSRLATTRARRNRFIVLGVGVSLVIVALTIATLRSLHSANEAEQQKNFAEIQRGNAETAKKLAEDAQKQAQEQAAKAAAAAEIAKKEKDEADEMHERLEEFARRAIALGIGVKKGGGGSDGDSQGAPSPTNDVAKVDDALKRELERVRASDEQNDRAARLGVLRQYFRGVQACDAAKVTAALAPRAAFSDKFAEAKDLAPQLLASCKPNQQFAVDVAFDPVDKSDDILVWTQFPHTPKNKRIWLCTCRHMTVPKVLGDWKITAIFDTKLGNNDFDATCSRKNECFGAPADPFVLATSSYEWHETAWNDCSTESFGKSLAPKLECAGPTDRDDQIAAVQACSTQPEPTPPKVLPVEHHYVPVDVPAKISDRVAFLACPPIGETTPTPKLVVMIPPKKPNAPYLFAGEAEQGHAQCFEQLGYKIDWNACKTVPGPNRH
jgi:hypothetical protein